MFLDFLLCRKSRPGGGVMDCRRAASRASRGGQFAAAAESARGGGGRVLLGRGTALRRIVDVAAAAAADTRGAGRAGRASSGAR